MDKYIKRIQTRLSRQGFSFTKQQIKAVYSAFVKDAANPTEEEIATVMNKLKFQLKFTVKQTEEPETDSALTVASEQPETIEITPQDNPDIWETLQPPAQEQPQPTQENTDAPNQQQPATSLTNLPATAQSNQIIPHSEVKEMVSSTFANQPQEFKDQVTEYALQHSFDNVRQVQEFLEQLRGMEFNLLVQTLQDHFNRRGSMLNVLNEVLSSQQQKDEENRQDFFNSFHNRLASFQKEMEMKLSKQGL